MKLCLSGFFKLSKFDRPMQLLHWNLFNIFNRSRLFEIMLGHVLTCDQRVVWSPWPCGPPAVVVRQNKKTYTKSTLSKYTKSLRTRSSYGQTMIAMTRKKTFKITRRHMYSVWKSTVSNSSSFIILPLLIIWCLDDYPLSRFYRLPRVLTTLTWIYRFGRFNIFFVPHINYCLPYGKRAAIVPPIECF